jgi:hypothetical protein
MSHREIVELGAPFSVGRNALLHWFCPVLVSVFRPRYQIPRKVTEVMRKRHILKFKVMPSFLNISKKFVNSSVRRQLSLRVIKYHPGKLRRSRELVVIPDS